MRQAVREAERRAWRAYRRGLRWRMAGSLAGWPLVSAAGALGAAAIRHRPITWGLAGACVAAAIGAAAAAWGVFLGWDRWWRN